MCAFLASKCVKCKDTNGNRRSANFHVRDNVWLWGRYIVLIIKDWGGVLKGNAQKKECSHIMCCTFICGDTVSLFLQYINRILMSEFILCILMSVQVLLPSFKIHFRKFYYLRKHQILFCWYVYNAHLYTSSRNLKKNITWLENEVICSVFCTMWLVKQASIFTLGHVI